MTTTPPVELTRTAPRLERATQEGASRTLDHEMDAPRRAPNGRISKGGRGRAQAAVAPHSSKRSLSGEPGKQMTTTPPVELARTAPRLERATQEGASRTLDHEMDAPRRAPTGESARAGEAARKLPRGLTRANTPSAASLENR